MRQTRVACAVAGGRPYKSLLLCIKQTPFETLSRLKAQGQAPPAVRWERLRDRNQKHQEAVEAVTALLAARGYEQGGPVDTPRFRVVLREDLHPGLLQGVDLVISVGGDGTALSTAHFINKEHRTEHIPLLCVNSDPNTGEVDLVKKNTDERRSRGALCALRSDEVLDGLPPVLEGMGNPQRRVRMQASVVSTHCRTKLAPALNDILLVHPVPAAVSRFRMEVLEGAGAHGRFEDGAFSAWSSGVWISTATGSTAAIRSAGGTVFGPEDDRLQYAIREHLLESGFEHLAVRTNGVIPPGSTFHLRWNTQSGRIFVDGMHLSSHIDLSDEIFVSTDGVPPLLLYSHDYQQCPPLEPTA